MNKKLHFLFFCLLLAIVLYLCKDCIQSYIDKLLGLGKFLEPFGNQIIIHPDNANLDPQETTFSVLTYDTDLGSGVTRASIKRRLPSPVEDVDEPPYAQFEGSGEGRGGGSVGGDMGGADVRGIMSKLDDMNDKIGDMGGIVGAGLSATSIQLNSLNAEMLSALSGIDTDGDGALTSVEFYNYAGALGALGAGAGDGGLRRNFKTRIPLINQKLIEIIQLLIDNTAITPINRVNGLPLAPLPLAPAGTTPDYNTLKTKVQTNKDQNYPEEPSTEEIIKAIFLIILNYNQLGIPPTPPASGTVTNNSDIYITKLNEVELKKKNLLAKCYNQATYDTTTPGPSLDSNDEAITAAAVAAAAAAAGAGGIPGADYLINLTTALAEFSTSINSLYTALYGDVLLHKNRAAGTVHTPPPATTPPTTPPTPPPATTSPPDDDDLSTEEKVTLVTVLLGALGVVGHLILKL